MDMPVKLPTPAIILTDLPEKKLVAAGAAALVAGPWMLDVVVTIDLVVDTDTEVDGEMKDGPAVRVTVTVEALFLSSVVSSKALIRQQSAPGMWNRGHPW